MTKLETHILLPKMCVLLSCSSSMSDDEYGIQYSSVFFSLLLSLSIRTWHNEYRSPPVCQLSLSRHVYKQNNVNAKRTAKIGKEQFFLLSIFLPHLSFCVQFFLTKQNKVKKMKKRAKNCLMRFLLPFFSCCSVLFHFDLSINWCMSILEKHTINNHILCYIWSEKFMTSKSLNLFIPLSLSLILTGCVVVISHHPQSIHSRKLLCKSL